MGNFWGHDRRSHIARRKEMHRRGTQRRRTHTVRKWNEYVSSEKQREAIKVRKAKKRLYEAPKAPCTSIRPAPETPQRELRRTRFRLNQTAVVAAALSLVGIR